MNLIISLKNSCTDNQRHSIAHGRLIDSSVYRAWKEKEIWEIKTQISKQEKKWKRPYITPRFDFQVSYRIKVFLPSKRIDMCNYLKGTNDILVQAGVFKDDKWILPQFDPCEVDENNPRIEITI